MNLALTGFMGAGKTTTARRLSRILKVPFVDTDAEIVREHGAIADIFAREGEAQFRRLERAFLERLCATSPWVAAVGGGAVVDPDNRKLLRSAGLIVHLAVSPETAFSRVAHRRHRPLLGPEPSLEAIRSLLASRAKAYADSDLALKADGKSPIALANIIARWYRKRILGESALA
jgi:shikimate kinase